MKRWQERARYSVVSFGFPAPMAGHSSLMSADKKRKLVSIWRARYLRKSESVLLSSVESLSGYRFNEELKTCPVRFLFRRLRSVSPQMSIVLISEPFADGSPFEPFFLCLLRDFFIMP